MIKEFKWIFVNVLLLFFSVVYVLPDLIAEDKHLTQEYGTLSRVYIETYKYKPSKSLTYKEAERLVLVTSDRTEKTYKLSSHYRTYWKKFQNANAIGKELRVYLKTDNERTNPLKVKLNKIEIYGKSSIFVYSFLILAITVGLTAYNLYQIFEKN